MNTTGLGQAAEDTVAQDLLRRGYKILARNWRRPRCEIDIIAQKKNVVYFFEVKYRSSVAQGGGLEYVTPKKLKQLKFAAECWASESNGAGDYRLAAVSVNSSNLIPTVENYAEINL